MNNSVHLVIWHGDEASEELLVFDKAVTIYGECPEDHQPIRLNGLSFTFDERLEDGDCWFGVHAATSPARAEQLHHKAVGLYRHHEVCEDPADCLISQFEYELRHSRLPDPA